MKKLIKIGLNSVRSFMIPIANFIVLTVGVSRFGKENWGSLLALFLWIFLIALLVNWGNREYLIRKFSADPSKIFSYFYTNFFTRSLLLSLSLLLFFFFSFEVATLAVLYLITVHMYSSLDSLIVYNQKFGMQLTAEIIGFLVVLTGIFSFAEFSIPQLLILYGIGNAVRILWMLPSLKIFEKGIRFTIAFSEFRLGFYLFAFSASGWLISKADLYVVSLFLEKAVLSQYQVLITTFLMLQTVSALIVMPFTKHIYRIPDQKVKEIQKRLYYWAVPLVSFGIISIWILLEKVLKMHFENLVYILGFFICLPSFFYTLNVNLLIKKKLEINVIKVNLIAIFVTTLISLLLVAEYKIVGLLLSVCITQWMVLVLYKLPFNTKNQKIAAV